VGIIVHKGKMWKGLCMRENVGKVYDNKNGGRKNTWEIW